MSRETIEPFYFGTSSKPLFGCLYSPPAGPRRDCGVVLCHPMGEEYIRSHRSYRLLALRLSEVGFPVLRFDFYGCGDSSGDFEQVRLPQWLSDISTAIDEIRRRCGVTRVCLVGLRFGGTLAMMAGAERDDIDGVILWEPVVSGKAYLKELTTLHQAVLQSFEITPKDLTARTQPMEFLGFPVVESLFTALEPLDLVALRKPPAANLLVVASQADGETRETQRLKEHLESLGVPFEYRHLPSPPIWIEIANQGLVPHQLLQSLVQWLSEVYA